MTKRRRHVSWRPADDILFDSESGEPTANGSTTNHNGVRRNSIPTISGKPSLDTTRMPSDASNGVATQNGGCMNSDYVGLPKPDALNPFKSSAHFPLLSELTATEKSASLTKTAIPNLTDTKGGPAHVSAFTPVSTFLADALRADGSLLHKTLEHFAVGFYVFAFVFAPFVLTFGTLTVLLIPPLWVFAFAYLAWYIYDRNTPKKGSRSWKRFRQLGLWSHMANYFPMKLIKTADLPADRNYIIGSHPHGILSFGAFLTFCTEAVGFSELFPGLERRYAVTLPIQYCFPIRRELLLLTSTISSEASAIEHVLGERDHGTVVGIVPGGAAEALDSTADNFKLTLKNRKGFIKLALKYGASLVPMYNFGETSTYNQVPNPEGSRIRKFQNSLKGLTGVTLPFFYGCGFLNRFFGWMPFRTPIYTVVGKPIPVEKKEEPTCAEVDELHAKYLRELSQLFDHHKHKYGISPQVKLEFV